STGSHATFPSHRRSAVMLSNTRSRRTRGLRRAGGGSTSCTMSPLLPEGREHSVPNEPAAPSFKRVAPEHVLRRHGIRDNAPCLPCLRVCASDAVPLGTEGR